MHAIENAKVAAPAPPPAVALQTQLQLQLPGPGPGPRPGLRPRPRDINKTRQLRIAAILVSMSSVEGVSPIWGLNNAGGEGGSCAFDCLIKAVWSGLPWICWIGCAFVHRTADAASRTRALPLLFIESAWTTDDKNKTFKCA